jgi:regulatory protein
VNKYPPLNLNQARNYALRLLNQRSYSVASLRQKLKQRHVAEADIETIVRYLADLKFLDDTAYAKSVVRTESQFRHASAKRILHKLRQKGIAQETIQAALDDLDDATQLMAIEHHINRYLQRHPLPLSYQDKQKLLAQLYRKGFALSLIQRGIRTVEQSS